MLDSCLGWFVVGEYAGRRPRKGGPIGSECCVGASARKAGHQASCNPPEEGSVIVATWAASKKPGCPVSASVHW